MSLNWNKLANGQDLYKGDYVVTDELSEVGVKFDNNSRLNIPPNSLVKIDYVGDSIQLELVKGLVNLDLKNVKSKVYVKKGKKKYEVKARNGKVEVRSSGTKLEFSSSKTKVLYWPKLLKVGVLPGTASLKFLLPLPTLSQ